MCRSIWSSNIGNARICMENRCSPQTKRVTYFCKTCPKACKAKWFAIQTSTFLLWWFPLPLCRTINQSAYERNIPVGLLLLGDLHTYCWWTKSCTTKDDEYPIIYRVLYIPGGAGFLPSTVSFDLLEKSGPLPLPKVFSHRMLVAHSHAAFATAQTLPEKAAES